MNKPHKNKTSKMRFEKVTGLYKEKILYWLNKDHIKEFYYGKGLKNTLRNIELYCQGINNNGSYTFYHWIAFYDNHPFAFMATSSVEGPYNEHVV